MELITTHQREYWNEIIRSFPQKDIYYFCEYAESFQIHGDGSPVLIYVSLQGARMAYVMMQNDLADFLPFRGSLDSGCWYDWTTPYGYGGPLYDGEITDEWAMEAMKEIAEYAVSHGIVSQFFRFHPLLQNQRWLEKCSKVVYMKKTVAVNTESTELIWKNMTPNNRNMVRKAEKNGVVIRVDKGENIDTFIEIYKRTMEQNQADEYYYFAREYFEYILDKMHENTIIFYAFYDEKIISASIFFYHDTFMHYHLSGTLPEYRSLAPVNLLLTKAAEWAAAQGIKEFHLGGGVGKEDSLLRFKKHFNRNGLKDFCIGCNIFREDQFQRLVELRKELDSSFDQENPYMIRYRG